MSSTYIPEPIAKPQPKTPSGKRQRKILSPETRPSHSSEASSNPPESQVSKTWRMSKGEILTVQGQDRIVSQLVTPEPGVKDETKDVDLVVGIDPGPDNSGMAFFLRCKRTNNLKLELAVQLDTSALDRDALPSYLLGVAVKVATDLNVVSEFEKITKIKKIGFAIEQPAQNSFDNHMFLRSFAALLYFMRGPITDMKFKLVVVSPENARRCLNLLKQKTYLLRKQKTKECIEEGLGIFLPRHDTSDAIAQGLAAIISKRLTLVATDFADDAMWPFFASEEELQKKTEEKRKAKEKPEEVKDNDFDEELYSELFDEKNEDD